MRRSNDGGYWFPTKGCSDEKSLRKQGFIEEGSKLYPATNWVALQAIESKFPGETATLIGKGPSLGRVKSEDLTRPTICINESIHAIESHSNADFIIQSDGKLKDACFPRRATLLLHSAAKGWYPGVKNKILFDARETFKETYGQPSAVYALYFIKLMGCVKVRMLAFDAATSGNIGYAVGTPEKYLTEKIAGERFLKHKFIIEQTARKLNLELSWVKVD